MAKNLNLLFCTTARNEPSGATAIDNLINFFMFDFLPTQFSFDVVFTISEFTKGQHIIKFLIKDTANSEVILDTNNVNIDFKESINKTPQLNCINFVLNIRNMVFKNAGIHRAELYFDNNCIGEKEFYVSKK